MKKRYFKFIEIDNNVVVDFLNRHSSLKKFINPNIPFYVRVSRKVYPALIHTILCQDVNNKQANISATLISAELNDRITAKRVSRLSDVQLEKITTHEKAVLIKTITQDIISKKLNIKKLVKMSTAEIINILSQYNNLSINTIKQFCLFTCFKQDVLCDSDPDFVDGLKIYLNKKDITKQDIINIEKEFSGQYTLFSLCMWRIKNERSK